MSLILGLAVHSQEVIPFKLNAHNNLSNEAVLNNTDTLQLMFHTAASDMTLTTAATQWIKSVQWDQENKVKSWGGSSNSRVSASNTLNIGTLHWDSLAIWENERSGPGTDGKFGLNLFEGKIIEINFDKSEMIIHSSLPIQIEGFVKTPLLFEDESMFIEGISTIDDEAYPNRFLIHSGYGGTILLDDKFVAESNIGKRVEIIAEKELKDSYGNTIKTKKGLLTRFTIGNFDFENMPVGFFEGAIGRQQMSVLGGDLLKRFNIIIDAEREFIYLKPNELSRVEWADI
ncbi:hypothetical protein OAB13_05980 [Salibacteraceae bacterium]|nr:hypothetical protein [Salibacteraceae bacterium]MDC1303951.1 hypothetical protein [Salibacteraceae bacterium]